MNDLSTQLVEIYLKLGGGIVLGWILAILLPKSVPSTLGRFLFWVGVPIGIVAFIYGTDLSGSIWIAPVAAWTAMLLGGAFAGVFLTQGGFLGDWKPPTQGSFLLGSMFGNTGYIAYPVILALVDPKFFGWAIFYDLAGTVVGAYGLGAVLGARFGQGETQAWQIAKTLVQNPTLWALVVGLVLRQVVLPVPVQQSLQGIGWGAIALALVLIGMRLQGLTSWRYSQRAIAAISIKMLFVPLLLGYLWRFCGLSGTPHLIIVLQTAMPPAFATLVIAEAYELDRDLAVTTLAIGSFGFLFLLPLWLFLFS